MYSDFHVHSHFSHDASCSIEEICLTAIKKGMKSVCVTDHIDAVHFQLMNDVKVIEKYFKELERVRSQYRNDIRLVSGFEFSEPNQNISLYREVMQYPFEYRMLSVHHCKYDIFPSPSSIDAHRATHEYLANIKDALSLDGFDAVGHIDLIRRYFSYFPYCSDEIQKVLKIIIDKGLWLEINTSCLPRTSGDALCAIDYVEEYRHLGGTKIALGSDAHCLADIGRRFNEISLENANIKI